MKNILLVEDDDGLRESLAEILESSYGVTSCASLQQAKESLLKTHLQDIDLVLLDLSLPDGSGMELISEARKIRPSLPIFILSGKDDPSVKIAGLDLGACDYMVKPFNLGELNARIRARLREGESSAAARSLSRVYSKFGMEIDEGRFKVFVSKENQKVDADLSPVEFKLLIHFIENEGQVFSRDQLISSCSGSGYVVSGRSIDVHVCALRKKLGIVSKAIRTIYGAGYMFDSARLSSSLSLKQVG